MATGQTSPKRGKVVDIPGNPPTIGTATDLAQTGKVSVPFTAGSTTTGGPVFYYTAVSNPGSITGTATSTPITVSGLTDGTAYTFTVAGTNATGNGQFSAASNSATPTVTPTSFESIATVTATGGETSLTFTSIPGTYKSLQIRGIARGGEVSAYARRGTIRFNSDSGANYTQHTLTGNGTAAGLFGYGTTSYIYVEKFAATDGSISNTYAASIIDLIDYASTSKLKTLRVFAGGNNNNTNTQYGLALGSGLWRSTSAITTIQIGLDGETFMAGSTFALYGMKG